MSAFAHAHIACCWEHGPSLRFPLIVKFDIIVQSRLMQRPGSSRRKMQLRSPLVERQGTQSLRQVQLEKSHDYKHNAVCYKACNTIRKNKPIQNIKSQANSRVVQMAVTMLQAIVTRDLCLFCPFPHGRHGWSCARLVTQIASVGGVRVARVPAIVPWSTVCTVPVTSHRVWMVH